MNASAVPALLVLAFDWGFGLWLGRRLPQVVPVHWNVRMDPDGWGDKAIAAFLLPALATLIWLLAALMARRGWALLKADRTGRNLSLGAVLLLVALHLFFYAPLGLGRAPLGHGGAGLRGILALFLVYMGNLLPRLEFRTHYREAWKPAMRYGGRAMVAAGLVLLAFFWLPEPLYGITATTVLLVAALVPYVAAQRLIARIRAQAPLPSPDPLEPGPGLHPNDLLAAPGLAGALAGALLVPGRPLWALTLAWAAPVLLWTLLYGEARLRAGGEVGRARAYLRGWVLLGLGLETFALGACAALGAPRPAIIAFSLLPLGVVGLGQRGARHSASPLALAAWDHGPALWDGQDPRVITPKLMGWTCNFAHAASWILLAAILASLLLTIR
jgi:hypothetical protein